MEIAIHIKHPSFSKGVLFWALNDFNTSSIVNTNPSASSLIGGQIWSENNYFVNIVRVLLLAQVFQNQFNRATELKKNVLS